jgi:hypothetical protein
MNVLDDSVGRRALNDHHLAHEAVSEELMLVVDELTVPTSSPYEKVSLRPF